MFSVHSTAFQRQQNRNENASSNHQWYLCEYLVKTDFNDERLDRWIMMAFNCRERDDKSQTL